MLHCWRLLLRLLLAGATLAAATGCSARPTRDAGQPAPRNEALQQLPPEPAQRLLIVGDSTGAGTGASTPRSSLAGLIAQDHPRLRIDNRARDGATFASVAQQLAGDEHYDVILVLVGGNDVIRLRDLAQVRADIDRVVALASARTGYLVLMPAGNVGNLRVLLPPVSWLMTSRSRTLHELVSAAAARHEAAYVNLFREADVDPFVANPDLTAPDGLHPSDEGYRLWYRELLAQTALADRLAIARAAR